MELMFKKKKDKPWWKKIKGKKVLFFPMGELPGVDMTWRRPSFPILIKENSSKPTEVLWLFIPRGKEHFFFEFMHKIPYSEDFMWKKSIKDVYHNSCVR
jgi:hypothetical protein